MKSIFHGYRELVRREPQYLKLILANIVGRIGDSIDSIAYGWMVYALTDSSAWLSVIFGVNALPTILFQPFAGVWVERMDKKKVMMVCDMGRGAIIALTGLLYMLGMLRPWHLLAFTFASSTLEAFRIPAGLSLLPRVLGQESYDHGMALNRTIGQVGEIAGLAMAGGIIALMGAGGALMVDGAAFILSALILLWVRPREAAEDDAAQGGYWQQARAGVNFLRENRVVLGLCVMAVVINFAFVPASSLQTAFVQETLHLGVEALTVASICQIAAMSLGAFIYPALSQKVTRKKLMVIGAVGLAAFYGMLVLCILPRLPQMRLIMLGAAFVLMGLSLSMVMMTVNIAFMRLVPQSFMGRVGAIFNAVGSGATPLASFLVAGAVSILAIDWMYGMMGVLMLALAAGIGFSTTLRGLNGGMDNAPEGNTGLELP